MALTGRALADAFVKVHADMSSVGQEVQRGLGGAVQAGARSVGRPIKNAILDPVKAGFAEGVRAADPGGAAVGGRFRQGIIGRLRGIGADTQRAGVDAGAGIDRGIGAKMRDVAATTTRGGQQAGAGFARGIGGRAREAILAPLREGFAEGVRQADPGGQAVGGRFRQGLAARLRGVAADTTQSGVDAGAGFQRGVSGKMRDVAATTARGGQEAGRQFARSTGRGAESEGPYLKRVGGSAAKSLFGAFAAERAGEVAVEGTIELFRGAVEGASDLSEAGNKLQVLFGPAAPKVQQWAAGAATALGQSTLQAEDAAATFGVFAQSAGLAGDQSAQFSEQMVGLASDMASFSNTTPDQAIEAIGAALRGETEPIRAYGVLLDDATLRNRALALGIVSTTKNALTPQQRVLAAQAEIMRQTGAAQGDFARTSGGLANQQRILAAQFANAQAALGQQLLPVMLRAVTFLNTVGIPAFSATVGLLGRIPGPIYAIAAGAVGLYGAVRAVSAIKGAAVSARDGIVSLGASAEGANRAMTALGKGAGIVGIAAIAAELAKWGGAATTAKVGTDQLVGSLTQLGRTGTTSGAALDVFRQGWGPFAQDVHTSGEAMTTFGDLAKGALGGANESFLDFIGRAQSGSERMGRLTAITQQYDTALAQMVAGGQGGAARQVFDQLAAAATAQGVSLDRVKELFPQYAAALDAAGTSAQSAAGTTAHLTGEQNSAAAAATAQKRALDDLTGSLDANNNKVLQLRGGETGYWAAVQAASDAVRTNGRTLDVHSAKGRANRQVLDSLASSGIAYLGTIRKNIGTGPVFNRTLDQQWNRLYQAGRRFGLSEKAARNYANQIYNTPKALATKVTTPGLAAARAGVRGLGRDIHDVNGRKVNLEVTSSGEVIMHVNRYLSARAHGGPIPGQSPTATADNVLVRATAGEHMWSVAEVNAAGGHRAVAALRKRALAGQLQGLAAGGPVERRLAVQGRARNFPPRGGIDRYMGAVFRAVAEAQRRYLRDTSSAGGGGMSLAGVPTGGGGGGAVAIGRRMAAAMGWTGGQWAALYRLWQGESGWNPLAHNPSSGAHGIPQSLPASKMASAGADYYTNPATQIRWGLGYIRSVYGTPAHAYSRWLGRSPHWYAAGTRYADPGWAVLGENGPELVRMRGGEQVTSAAGTRAATSGRGGPGVDQVRLHPDTVAQLAGVLAGALARQPIVMDGRAVAGYVDRSLGRASLSARS